MLSREDLKQFVRDNVRSVWALELLLTLRRDPEKCWSVDQLVSELRASTMLVTSNLDIFQQAGLAVEDDTGCYRYAPASPVLDSLCQTLEAAYRERPVATVNLIVRSAASAVQSLADAFKFRGDGK